MKFFEEPIVEVVAIVDVITSELDPVEGSNSVGGLG